MPGIATHIPSPRNSELNLDPRTTVTQVHRQMFQESWRTVRPQGKEVRRAECTSYDRRKTHQDGLKAVPSLVGNRYRWEARLVKLIHHTHPTARPTLPGGVIKEGLKPSNRRSTSLILIINRPSPFIPGKIVLLFVERYLEL